jgi:nicotinate phosphoribosyltransferase
LNTYKTLYHNQFSLLTDLYQLTMAYGYWKSNMIEHEAVFHLFFRHNPFHGGYTIAAGLANAIDYLSNLRFREEDIEYLASLRGDNKKPLFEKAFLAYLKKLRFTVDVDAIEEGTVVFPQEPLIRVKGPLIQCQLLESALLNCTNFPSLVATKASRVCYAAKGQPVVEFGLRRAQGFDGGLTASRAAYIGGCVGTSNVLAGKLYDIPVRGTHAHSWIMAFPDEKEAFTKFTQAMPNNCYLLVDTYNTLEGVKNAIKTGKKLAGVRLDSGDLAYLSIKTRQLLDHAGLKNVKIMASNDLDEHIITSLKQQHAKIDVWAVGTKLATAFDQPALDGVYKLSAIREKNGEWQYKLKLSEQIAKTSVPGILRPRRFFNKRHHTIADVIYDEITGINDACTIIDSVDPTNRKKISPNTHFEELLKPIFRHGKLIYKVPSIHQSRQRTFDQLEQFHPAIRRFLNPHIYPVGLEKRLFDLRMLLVLNAREIV